jgi:hypothetical protein
VAHKFLAIQKNRGYVFSERVDNNKNGRKIRIGSAKRI